MDNEEIYSDRNETIKNRMVRLKPETADVLSELRIARRESYDEVIKRLLIQLKISRLKKRRDEFEHDFVLSDDAKRKINESLKDVRDGKVLSTDELFKRLYGNKKGRFKI